MKLSATILILALTFCSVTFGQQKLKFERSVITEGNADWDMTQVRTAYVPGKNPFSITTMSKTAKKGAHGYHDVFLSVSRDDGKTWSEPKTIPSLKRAKQDDGYETVAGDLWPLWHAASGRILVTGKLFNFEGGTKENILREKVAYTSIDPKTLEASPLRILELPKTDREGKPFIAPNAGCHQWVALPNGDIMLTIRYQKTDKKRNYTSTVIHCHFDGEMLKFIAQGTEHNIPTRRGLYEPSVTKFDGEYFLTMRADDGAWVTKSSDGLEYPPHKEWTFDDGKLLGSYNTQQHFATIGGKLYLIYTRKGANNDHIKRHRAPLFIGEVDTDKLHVIRATEQILVPENDATLGNSGVCQISETETWITVAEGRVSMSKRRAGENNKVFLVKITN